MKRGACAAFAALGLVLAGCSEEAARQAVNNPSPTVSAVVSQGQQALCQAQREVLQTVEQVRATPLSSKADLVSRLDQTRATLDAQAGTLESRGQTDLATNVRTLAVAVGRLRDAVQSQRPADILSAAQAVGAAVGSLPTCPSG